MNDDSRSGGTSESKEPMDDLVVTHHTLRTASGDISYTARSGRVVLREEEVTKKAVFAFRPAFSPCLATCAARLMSSYEELVQLPISAALSSTA